ncbi:hypothetical protein N0V93_002428 [Gnomoniopsis smithogilvyi]|uniref:Endo-1,4-beta-xylanase n=1 Tax=Gnomoniopsis smithogilvyi TaxID=1191159 RepID=A0A9W9CXN2_9PEZI|nr:hypothetical protein N0V93_002428 [Gnomoniopsis smithogilvyi]
MVAIKSLIALLGVSAVSALPTGEKLEARDTVVTASGTGTAGGYYYSNYVETGTDTFTIGTGKYSLSWSSSNTDVVSGIGWSTGSARTITYTGSLNAGGDSLLALYGWTTSPLVEYYVIETYGSYNPGSAGTKLGSVTSDGGTYDIYKVVRSNAPSIQGTQTFNQYLSIRQSKRTSGTITFANHIAAWKNVGLTLGAYNYQIMATEGYQSTGTSSITLS